MTGSAAERPEVAERVAERLADVGGEAPSWLCRTTLDVTGDETLTRIIDVVLGVPLAIAIIVVAALVYLWKMRASQSRVGALRVREERR